MITKKDFDRINDLTFDLVRENIDAGNKGNKNIAIDLTDLIVNYINNKSKSFPIKKD